MFISKDLQSHFDGYSQQQWLDGSQNWYVNSDCIWILSIWYFSQTRDVNSEDTTFMLLRIGSAERNKVKAEEGELRLGDTGVVWSSNKFFSVELFTHCLTHMPVELNLGPPC